MNTKLLAAIFTFLLAGGLIIGYLVTREPEKNPASSTNTSNKNGAPNRTVVTDACKVLTQAVAENALGQTVQQGQNGAQTSSNDLVVSTCTYTAKPDVTTSATNLKSITLLTRSARTNTGNESNRSQFGSQKPAGVQDVSGYGSAAFWNPQYGQLNVLKGNNWYIISIGDASPANRSIDEAKKLADALGLENKGTHE